MLPESKGPGTGSRTLGLVSMVGCGGLAVLSLCPLMFFLNPANTNGGGGQFIFGIVLFAGVAVWGFSTYQRAGKVLAAKKVVDQIASEIDMDEFEKLDQEFGGNPSQVSQLRTEAQAALAQFFGDAKWLTS